MSLFARGPKGEKSPARARKGLLATLAATKLDRDAFVLPAVKILSHTSHTFHTRTHSLLASACLHRQVPNRALYPRRIGRPSGSCSQVKSVPVGLPVDVDQQT